MNDHDGIQVAAARAGAAGLFAGWHVGGGGDGGTWTVYRPSGRYDAEVGLKIHISAGLGSAADLLDRVLPILARARYPFKHAATMQHLAWLSSGRAGVAQIGKFLTVYPPSSPDARRLAWALHQATTGLGGPRIAGDVPVTAGSLVHVRYGAFTERWLQLPTGRITTARRAGDSWEPDEREAPTPVPRPAGGRYVLAQRLHASPKGSTWLGFRIDGDGDDLLVVKQAHAFVMEAADGADARSRLRHEAELLRTLAGTGVTPDLVDAWDEADLSFLVYRLVEGPTFASLLTALAEQLTRPPISVLRGWAAQLCDAVGAIHAAGLVLGDVKPANLIVTDRGFRVVDVELTGPPTSEPVPGIGTPGYMSPQQGDPAMGRGFSDDVYAVGATLLSAALLVDASALPDSRRAALYELARDPGNAYFTTVARCLDPDPAGRPGSVEEIRHAVHRTRARGRSATPPRRPSQSSSSAPRRLELARDVGDILLRSAVRRGRHVFWTSQHPIQSGQAGRDLYAGSAGPALFLAALATATRDGEYLEAALGTGRWLWEAPPTYARQVPMPGLYFGECGPGLLYLALAGLTGDDGWARRARAVADRVHAMPAHSPDLMTGAAGTVLYLLAVHRALGDESMLARAGALVEGLARTCDRPGFRWPIPPDHDGLSGQAYLGMSHGTAGIGYAIAEYAAAAEDVAAHRLCADVAAWLVDQAVPCLPDGSGLTWSASGDPGSPRAVYWCHGAPGILRFLVRASEVTGEAALIDAAERAGRTVVAGSVWCGTSQCHGLAGNVEALVDLWQGTGDDRWLRLAGELADNLAACRRDDGDWPTEYRDVVAPDLMVGRAGVGAGFLRLAVPHSDHLLSPAASRPVTDPLGLSNGRPREGRTDHAQHAEERAG